MSTTPELGGLDLAPGKFVLTLPKAELHLHLEGTVDPLTLVELSARHPEPLTKETAHALYHYRDFSGFMMAFKAVTERMRTPEDFELVAYNLIAHLAAQNVLHAEVYVSVGVVLWRGERFEPLFEGLERGRERGERDYGVSVLWIFDAVRHFGPAAAKQVVDLAVTRRERNVVGIGIGGDERRAGPEDFRDIYRYAADHGLHLTAHAGETVGPESIWGALNLNVERVGHGLHAWQDPELVSVLAERQIPIEICISSNVRTGCCETLEDHPVRRYFDQGLMITLNTDDPAMFETTLAREYQIAHIIFGLTHEQLREIARNSFEASFLPAEKKVAFLEMFR